MTINEWAATDAYDYAFVTEIVAVFKDALESERAAERKAAAMKGQG